MPGDRATSPPAGSSTPGLAPRPGNGRGRRRPPPRRVTVVSLARLAPRLVSVVVAGEGVRDFATPVPTAHVKVAIPAPQERSVTLPEAGPDGPIWPEGAPRPAMRTYTPRRVDTRAGTLELQFVLHGEGPASEWAQRARIGDELGVTGPGGRFSLDLAGPTWWIAGDESALPAIAMLLEALPRSATAEVHVEVAAAEDEVPLESAATTMISWHHRAPGTYGEALLAAARGGAISPSAQAWVACESVAVRRIRAHLLEERLLPAGAVTTRGYWHRGAANHPDHDYGED